MRSSAPRADARTDGSAWVSSPRAAARSPAYPASTARVRGSPCAGGGFVVTAVRLLWTEARGRPVHSRARRRPGGHNVSHMVIFQTPDGNPGYNQFETVEEAVEFVEKLRNDQGIDNARMFALEEIKFDLKPYYRVELQALIQGTPPTSQAPFASPP